MRGPPLPEPTPHGEFREGHGWRGKDLEAYISAGGLQWNMLQGVSTKGMRRQGDYFMNDVTQEYEKANKIVSDAHAAYTKTLDQFRSNIKNDLASIGASADRVQREATKMRASYEATAKILTSPEMEKAIANAERLATALTAISELKSHNITFAVLDKKPPST